VNFAPPLMGLPLELGTGAGMMGLYRTEKEVWWYL